MEFCNCPHPTPEDPCGHSDTSEGCAVHDPRFARYRRPGGIADEIARQVAEYDTDDGSARENVADELGLSVADLFRFEDALAFGALSHLST